MELLKPEQIHKEKYYVYMLLNPISKDPFYVGKGIRFRAWQHIKETYDKTTNRLKLKTIRDIQKLTGEDPIVDIIYEGLTNEGAYILEDYLIYKYGRLCDDSGILTNYLVGEKSPVFYGKNHPNYGKKMSEETKRKISESNKKRFINGAIHPLLGVNMSDDTKLKISKAKKGKMSAESRQKLSEYAKRRHIKQTDYQKQRCKETHSKYYKILCPSGEIIEGYSLLSFCKERKLTPSNLKIYGHSKGYKLLS